MQVSFRTGRANYNCIFGRFIFCHGRKLQSDCEHDSGKCNKRRIQNSQKRKIKIRKQSIFGKIFGIEGDYAYKSVMRNPGRFHKTVWALAVGIGGFVAIVGIGNSLSNVIKEETGRYKYYQVFYETVKDIIKSEEEMRSDLPSAEVLENIANMKEVTEAKRIYSANVFVSDVAAVQEKYNQEYLEETMSGIGRQRIYEQCANSEETEVGEIVCNMNILAPICCYGYDEEDYQRYQKVLTDGTLMSVNMVWYW